VWELWDACHGPLPGVRWPLGAQNRTMIHRAFREADGDLERLRRGFTCAAADPYYAQEAYGLVNVVRNLGRWLTKGDRMARTALPAPPAVSDTSLRSQVFALLGCGEEVDPLGWRPEQRPVVTAAIAEWASRHGELLTAAVTA